MITEMIVKGMDAPGCAYNAKIALEMLDGVERADVDFDSHTARIVHGSRVKDDDLICLLERFGFTVEIAS